LFLTFQRSHPNYGTPQDVHVDVNMDHVQSLRIIEPRDPAMLAGRVTSWTVRLQYSNGDYEEFVLADASASDAKAKEHLQELRTLLGGDGKVRWAAEVPLPEL
jgi:hypothetical protein